MNNKTSIIILTYNNLKYTKNCIESIRKYTKENTYEIIIVDNNSIDGTKDWLKKQDDIKVIYNEENVGFPKGCNQGISISNKNNDILLLNNDTIVTANWLKNLKTCLYSSDSIGAVGPVCNNNENNQGEYLEFKDFDDMEEKCEKFNISNSSLWEEKIFLIGFCLLIKRKVFDKIEKLDENYTPGYIEDNDLSLRIIKKGYKLILCHDTYIYHYLGTSFRKNLDEFYNALFKNRQYFINKWGFNTFIFDEIKTGSIPLLKKGKDILDINGGIGVNALYLKYKFKCNIDVLEKDKFKRTICKRVLNTYKNMKEINKVYDYILIGNELEYVNDPVLYLRNIKKYLKDGGFIIGEFNNVSSIEEIIKLLDDDWYYSHRDKMSNYTLRDIERITKEAGLKNMEVFSWYKNMNESEQKIYEVLCSVKKKNYEYTSFAFKVSNS